MESLLALVPSRGVGFRIGAAVSLLTVVLGCAPSKGSAAPNSSGSVAPSSGPAPSGELPELEPEAVLFALRGNQDQFRKCFLRSMKSRGIVAASFRLSSDGIVQAAEVSHSTLGNTATEACLVARLRELRFGELGAAKRGRWTFVFRLSEPVPEHEFKRRLNKERARASEGGVLLAPSSQGELDPESVAERVHARYGLFAGCYRSSIGRRSNALGLLRLRIALAADGAVQAISDAGSVMPDPYAVDCVAEAFYAMPFPKPSGGPVEILYRLDLE